MIGLILGVGFLVACGFVVGQPSVRVIHDPLPPVGITPQAPTVQSPATHVAQIPSPGPLEPPAPKLANPADLLTPMASTGTTTTAEAAPAPKGSDAPGDAGAQSSNPTGRQEPAVSLEWVGPPTVKLGQPARFQIVVKNVSSALLHNTMVRSQIPTSVSLKASEPKATADGDTLSWDLGELAPQQERRIDLIMVPDSKGRGTCKATVTFSGTSMVQLQVQEPKLIL